MHYPINCTGSDELRRTKERKELPGETVKPISETGSTDGNPISLLRSAGNASNAKHDKLAYYAIRPIIDGRPDLVIGYMRKSSIKLGFSQHKDAVAAGYTNITKRLLGARPNAGFHSTDVNDLKLMRDVTGVTMPDDLNRAIIEKMLTFQQYQFMNSLRLYSRLVGMHVDQKTADDIYEKGLCLQNKKESRENLRRAMEIFNMVHVRPERLRMEFITSYINSPKLRNYKDLLPLFADPKSPRGMERLFKDMDRVAVAMNYRARSVETPMTNGNKLWAVWGIKLAAGMLDPVEKDNLRAEIKERAHSTSRHVSRYAKDNMDYLEEQSRKADADIHG